MMLSLRTDKMECSSTDIHLKPFSHASVEKVLAFKLKVSPC